MDIPDRPAPDRAPSSAITDRLDSWKEIAAYLKRDERTVRRWELEGLPVHRHLHKKRAAVYAYKAEIDGWWRNGHHRLEPAEAKLASAKRRIVPWRLTLTSVLALAVTLGLYFVTKLLPLGHVQSARRTMLVVLPLDNLGVKPEQDYFSAGLTEEITTQLSELQPERLGVIAHTSALRYKTSGKPISEIGRELGVDYVVEGGVLRQGDQVRVSAQLIRARDQGSIWAEEYEGNLRDVLVLQAKISEAIAEEIGLKLTLPEQTRLASSHFINPNEHEAYLRGIYELRKLTPDGLENAIQYFQRVLEQNPNNALAYTGLADAYSNQSTRFKAPLAVMPQARAAASKAVEVDDSLSDAHAVLGFIELYFDWDWKGAEKEFRRALELNPNQPSAHAGYAGYLLTLGHADEAQRELQRAQELNPLLPVPHGDPSWFSYEMRQYGQAVAAAQRGGSKDDWVLALSYAELGRAEEASSVAERVLEAESNPLTLSQMAVVYARVGQKQKARRLADEAEQKAAQRYVCGVNLGGAYAVIGDNEKALAWLERAYRDRSD